ncbi:MAG: alanine--tRNA ligase [Candidatus Aenigmatarchaeota archaeon]
MRTKKELIQEFQKNPNRFWKVKIFDELGFERRQCSKCGKYFWSIKKQETCNDSSCRTYDFIGKPPTKKSWDIFETWKRIQKFFVDSGHIALERYPTVCRWYPLYFTIAGIVNFYRIGENNNLEWEFPANPTILLQPCLRFNDIPNVGLNSKSFTCFGMVQQTSLFDGKKGYWKDKCIELDFELLTKVFGIKPEEINFIEDAWLGYGAFGSSLEYHVQGIELGNAVFTEFLGTPENYKEAREKIIDMGAGLERLTWITQGTPTCYDAVFGPVLEKMKKACGIKYDEKFFVRFSKISGRIDIDEFADFKPVLSFLANTLKTSVEELQKTIEPLHALYAIADHARALVFAIADGGLPSNVAGGYNLRVILRRSLSFIDKFGWNLKIEDVANWHIDYLKKMFPELEEKKEEIEKILEIEVKRYKNTKERAKRIIQMFAQRRPTEEELIKLYDSEGITPEQLRMEVSSDFYKKVTERHMVEKKEERKIALDISNLPKTKILYYGDTINFKAKVLKVSGNFVVLDRTAFYPTSGGQEHDTGYIGENRVVDVIKANSVVVHQLESCDLREGQIVKCKVDKRRREILKKHHDAIHIISGAVKKILGQHVHQYGAEKTEEKARIDITHYEALSEDEEEKIENLANMIVQKGLPIKKFIMERGEAEKKYGFGIYAGGYIPSKKLRIVEIKGFDVEACGGLHNDNTREVGLIKILRTKRIADGLVRIEIKAGEVALEYLREKEKILNEVAKKLNVKEEEIVKAVGELFEKWKKLRKELKKRERNDFKERVEKAQEKRKDIKRG